MVSVNMVNAGILVYYAYAILFSSYEYNFYYILELIFIFEYCSLYFFLK